MKRIILLLVVSSSILACGDKTSTAASTETSATDTSQTELPYTTENPVAWEWGSRANIKTAMSALKAFEEGNIQATVKDFADSVLLEFDGYEKLVSRDTAAAVLKSSRDLYKTITLKMDDYESVKSKDGKSEYVSLWYKQVWEDVHGNVDSFECMNDIRFKDGKITLVNEKTRKYGTK